MQASPPDGAILDSEGGDGQWPDDPKTPFDEAAFVDCFKHVLDDCFEGDHPTHKALKHAYTHGGICMQRGGSVGSVLGGRLTWGINASAQELSAFAGATQAAKDMWKKSFLIHEAVHLLQNGKWLLTRNALISAGLEYAGTPAAAKKSHGAAMLAYMELDAYLRQYQSFMAAYALGLGAGAWPMNVDQTEDVLYFISAGLRSYAKDLCDSEAYKALDEHGDIDHPWFKVWFDCKERAREVYGNISTWRNAVTGQGPLPAWTSEDD